MPSLSYPHDIYLLFTAACIAVALESCSAPVTPTPPEPVAGWYKSGLYEGKPFYVTKNAIIWTSGRKKADFGHWTAVSVYDSSVYLKAEGNTFTISPGYGWDGVTRGTTPPDMLLPSLFHDAMLHAKMNGAPIPRSRIDLAFYDLMTTQHATHKGIYYRFVRLFGWCFTAPQYPRTLSIRQEGSRMQSKGIPDEGMEFRRAR